MPEIARLLVLRRWPYKILAIALAYAIWLTVVGEDPTVQDFQAPLDIAVADEDIVVGQPPTEVLVRLRGTPSRLDRLESSGRLEARVDLTEGGVGDRTVQLGEEHIDGVPGGVEVVRLEPARVTVGVDRRARKEVPVEPTFVGQPAQDYMKYSAQCVPSSVEIEGPAELLATIDHVRTDPIPLEGERRSKTVRVSPVSDDPEARILFRQPVAVRVQIQENPEVAEFVVPIDVIGFSGPVRVDPESWRVRIAAPPSLLGNLDGGLRAVIDATGLEPRRAPYEFVPRLTYPGIERRDLVYFDERGGRPAQVRVWLREGDRGS